MHVSVGLLESDDPARGRVIVHPTPGASSPQALAHDLLGALGRAVNRLNAEQLAGPAAGRAVTAWMVTDQIDDLVVMRADRLSAGAWTWVLGLCRESGSRVLLVCHTRQIPAHLNAVLAGTGYQLLIGLPQARVRPDRRRLPARAGRGPSLAEHPPRTGRGGGHLPERAAVPDLARARQPQPPSHAGPAARRPGRGSGCTGLCSTSPACRHWPWRARPGMRCHQRTTPCS